MKDINVRTFILVMILYFTGNCYGKSFLIKDSTETFGDSMRETKKNVDSDKDKLHTLGGLSISEDGRWSAVTQLYANGKDSLLIFDSRKKNPVMKLSGLSSPISFLPDNFLYATVKGKVLFIDLITKSRKELDNVKQSGILKESKEVYVLDNNKKVSVYISKGILDRQFQGIERLITDKEKILIGISELKEISSELEDKSSVSIKTTVLIDLSGKVPAELYRNKNKFDKIQLSENNSYLLLTEKRVDEKEVRIMAINLKTRKKRSFSIGEAASFLKFEVYELDHGKSLWIDVWKKEMPEKTIPDIWYGYDGDLKAKHNEYATLHDYYLWQHQEEEPILVKDKKFPVMVPVQNTEYVLAFNPRVNFKYRTRVPLPTHYLYYLKDKTYKTVFHHSLETIISDDGSIMVSYDSEEKQWILYEVKLDIQHKIGGNDLKRPVFDDSGDHIIFESNKGLWQYTISKKYLSVIEETEEKKVSILSSDQKTFNAEYHISGRTFSKNENLLLTMKNEENQTLYALYKKGRIFSLSAQTPNRITAAQTTKNNDQLYTIEENYNMPPRLYQTHIKNNNKKLIFADLAADRESSAIRQEIIKYKNSEGIELKGLLYYPIQFKGNQQYPMIVHIYQVRSSDSNVYTYRGDDVGFDLRALLRKGYFVYLPDIVYGEKGAGRSALDCVHAAIDALTDHSAINRQKIGLTGHSMGGYETNFIATHSHLFAAYISGSAHSDLIRNYFSYNYNTHIPQIWRIETGQYEMGVSFAEDKERYFNNSPIHYVDQVSAPILLWTGKKDENVQWDQTMEFFMGLKRFDKQVIALFYESGDHTFYETPDNNKDITKRSLEWWDYFLKDVDDIPWINQQIKKDAF